MDDLRQIFHGFMQVYHDVRKVYHGVRMVYHGVRKVKHGFRKAYNGFWKICHCVRVVNRDIKIWLWHPPNLILGLKTNHFA